MAVCSEAGLTRATSAAVAATAARGSISQNPGVLLSRLVGFLDALTPVLGRRGVLAVLRAAPTLLRHSPQNLRTNAEMLGGLLPERSLLPSIAARAPMLLGLSAMTLWGNFEALRALLGLEPEAALRLIVRAPRLLANTSGALQGRLAELAELAGGVPLATVAAVVARQPTLLGYFPSTLEGNLRNIASVLGVPYNRVQKLVLKQPGVVMLSRTTLAARLAALRECTALYDEAELASVVLRQPGLLGLSPAMVASKVPIVARVLRLEASPDALRCVLRGAPQLLALAADTLEGKAAALRAAVGPSAELSAQLDRTAPLTVASWLCSSAGRYEAVRAAALAAAAVAQEAGRGAGSGAAAAGRGVEAAEAAEATEGTGATASDVEPGGSGGERSAAVEAGAGAEGLAAQRPRRGRPSMRSASLGVEAGPGPGSGGRQLSLHALMRGVKWEATQPACAATDPAAAEVGKPARKASRPEALAANQAEPKRPWGRPRKGAGVLPVAEAGPKRPRGRPRKIGASPQATTA
ncbi:hypothetical protein HYH03_016599 [Edaphochlamys debaryana]|uniref:Uncharacterized protein n=1 Tax=Edaphochlamys debaryana TaxID=47281 RepID=A0A836BPS6_9CHLO|nr:hypothetical protein HYH03_016599 [Edaphochlamys debaryana]|eukprot:KAG2484646.1 hypothetical protein HYH03_016599 [Edaphochlamys debaryana]